MSAPSVRLLHFCDPRRVPWTWSSCRTCPRGSTIQGPGLQVGRSDRLHCRVDNGQVRRWHFSAPLVRQQRMATHYHLGSPGPRWTLQRLLRLCGGIPVSACTLLLVALCRRRAHHWHLQWQENGHHTDIHRRALGYSR